MRFCVLILSSDLFTLRVLSLTKGMRKFGNLQRRIGVIRRLESPITISSPSSSFYKQYYGIIFNFCITNSNDIQCFMQASWYFNQLHSYCPKSNRWTSIATNNLPKGTAGHSANILGDCMIVFGGSRLDARRYYLFICL